MNLTFSHGFLCPSGEMVNTNDSKSFTCKSMEVQVLSRAKKYLDEKFFLQYTQNNKTLKSFYKLIFQNGITILSMADVAKW